MSGVYQPRPYHFGADGIGTKRTAGRNRCANSIWTELEQSGQTAFAVNLCFSKRLNATQCKSMSIKAKKCARICVQTLHFRCLKM